MQKWPATCGLQNSEGLSYTSTGEELPQQEILQAWWHSQAPQKCVWVGDQMGHHADAFFSSAGCAGFCNEPQHPPLTNNTSGEESFHSLIEKAQNEKETKASAGFCWRFRCRLHQAENGVRCTSVTARELCHCRYHFPLSRVMIQARFLPFPSVFSSPPSGLHNLTRKTSSDTGAAVTWARSQPAWVVCPALKSMCVWSLPPTWLQRGVSFQFSFITFSHS